MEAAPTVDINKLRYITKSLNKSPIINDSIDFSDFAEKNFVKSASFTKQPKNKQTRKQSKWLYNEVQRNSINFGITAEEMIAFHNQKKYGIAEITPKLPSLPQTPPMQTSKPIMNQEVNPQAPQVGNEPDTLQSPFYEQNSKFNKENLVQNFNKSVPPPRPKTRPPLLHIDTPQRQRVRSVTHTSFSAPGSKRNSQAIDQPEKEQPAHEAENSLSRTSSFKILKRKGSLSRQNSLIDFSETKSRLSSYSLKRRSSHASGRSSRAASTSTIPTQRECHSVEETLLADQEFNDFSVPARPKRTNPSNLVIDQFDFEKPLSRRASLGSPTLRSPNLDRSPVVPQLSNNSSRLGSPITPSRLRQRHSVAYLQQTPSESATSPPGLRSPRSSESYGSSPVRYSPRMSLRTSMSDLKASPIGKISEHEILHFGSPISTLTTPGVNRL